MPKMGGAESEKIVHAMVKKSRGQRCWSTQSKGESDKGRNW